MLQRIFEAIKSRRPLRPHIESGPPDPITKFPHPANRYLFSFLRRGWLEGSKSETRGGIDDYPLRTHPDLIERFRSLAPSAEVVQGTSYGRPVMANSSGIVFAWAGGMNQIFLRLPPELQQQAIEKMGRFDPTYGEDWIEFPAFGQRWGSRIDSEEALTRWMGIAYEKSLRLRADD